MDLDRMQAKPAHRLYTDGVHMYTYTNDLQVVGILYTSRGT